MNILGEGFPKNIINQINLRQKIYGSGYSSPRTPEEIIYLNANTSWCKLVSSVDITDQKNIQNQSLKDTPGINSNNLSKQFVLFNGTNNIDKGPRSGITPDNSILGDNNAYGIGGTEYGLRPMMGIQSVNVTHENRGSIRRATIKAKAFNKIQFEILNVLYLRLGFHMLLEWGHSMYFNNEGILQKGTDNDSSLVNDFIERKNFHPASIDAGVGGSPLTYLDFLKLIDYQRKISYGNYDAMLGRVSNYHWSFLPDGSYDITIDLVSIGEVIESFKINTLINGIENPTEETGTEPKIDSQVIFDSANKNEIGKYFWGLIGIISKGLDTYTENQNSTPIFFEEIVANLNSEETNPQTNILNILSKVTDYKIIKFNGNNSGFKYYIRLGTFLEFIQKNLMYYFKVGDKTSPMLTFDTDVESNIMYIDPMQISVDPDVCVVTRDLTINNKTYSYNSNGAKFESTISGIGSNYGQIMNIYVNMVFILKKLDEKKDSKDNKVVLIDFLTTILDTICGALGGINKLEVNIDETTNRCFIIDKNPLPGKDEIVKKLNSKNFNIEEEYAKFDLYGYKTTDNPLSAGFIKDFSLTTEITPELATMITVGATANSTVVGENSTAFSKFNAGLTDRYKEEIVYNLTSSNSSQNYFQTSNLQSLTDLTVTTYLTTPIPSTEIEKKPHEILGNKYAIVYNNYIEYIKKLAGPNPEYNGNAETYKDAIINYINYKQQFKQAYWKYLLDNKQITQPVYDSLINSSSPFTGFIPFNMSLTMDGLSGMKIYSKFLIDTEFLPSNYPKNSDFIIKRITHTIENNKWFTKLESILISQGDKIDTGKPDLLPTGQNNTQAQSNIVPNLGSLPNFIEDNTLLNLSSFVYPVTGNIVSKIIVRAVQNGVAGSDQHRGIDIAASKGIPVYSSTAGKVVRIGANGYGPNAVWIQIDQSAYTNPSDASNNPKYIVYGHLDTNLVNVGSIVSRGQQIGTVGDKDAPNRFHLHYQIRNAFSGYDSGTLSTNINTWFPPKGGSIIAKQLFINTPYQPTSI